MRDTGSRALKYTLVTAANQKRVIRIPIEDKVYTPAEIQTIGNLLLCVKKTRSGEPFVRIENISLYWIRAEEIL